MAPKLPKSPKLTEQQKQEIISLQKEGKTNEEIKALMGISDGRLIANVRHFSRLKGKNQEENDITPPQPDKPNIPPETGEKIDNIKEEEKGGNEMEQKELDKIVETVNKKIHEALPGTIEAGIAKMSGKIASEIETIRKQTEDRQKKDVERQNNQKKIDESLAQIPELSKQVKTLEEQFKTLGIKPSKEETETHSKGKGVFGTMHTNYEEFFNCPQCVAKLKDIVKKYGSQQVISEMCGDDEMCKLTVEQLSGRGFKIDLPTEGPTEEEKKKALADRAQAVGLAEDATEEEIVKKEEGDGESEEERETEEKGEGSVFD